MKITKEQEEEFQRSTNCYICACTYNGKSEAICDHCYVTGEYRGAANKICNLQLVLSTKVPVVLHNLRGYDSHFIMQEIGNVQNTLARSSWDINFIPTNSEKYMSSSWGKNLVCIDSFQFMTSSLEKLASNLPTNKYIHLKNEFHGTKNTNLLKKKGFLLL